MWPTPTLRHRAGPSVITQGSQAIEDAPHISGAEGSLPRGGGRGPDLIPGNVRVTVFQRMESGSGRTSVSASAHFLCEMLQRSKGVARVTRLHWPRGPGPCPPETLPSHALSSTLLSSYRKNSVHSYDFFGFFCFFFLVNDSHILQSPSFVF